ncbi:MAG: PPC domain-containing DNA-binding protein [Xanthobacter sp.]
MKAEASSQFPRPRTLIHPGGYNPVRIHSLHSQTARHIRLSLKPGLSLFEALVQPLAENGIRHASTTILGGMFSTLDYCVAPPDPTKKAVIAYTKPIYAGRTYMVFGNATVGVSMSGKPLVHCHAAIRTESGEVKGGHILTESSIIGETPISILVTSLDSFELRQSFDPETNIPLLQPCKAEAHD